MMMFSFKNKNNTNSNINQRNNANRPNTINGVNMLNQRRITPLIQPNVVNVPTPPPQTDSSKPKKMRWGEPTWYLFHALAEKVKEDKFHIVRQELLNTIYSICKNLPCPLCANHATEYMNGINFNTIQTKQNLIDLLWKFHNEVNQRKGVAVFPFDQLKDKYSKSILPNIIQLFMIHFKDKHASIRMIADDMFRAQLSIKIQGWFQQNIQYFDY